MVNNLLFTNLQKKKKTGESLENIKSFHMKTNTHTIPKL